MYMHIQNVWNCRYVGNRYGENIWHVHFFHTNEKKLSQKKTEDLIKEYIKTLHDETVPTITHSFRSIFSSTRNTATNSISPSSFSVNQYLSIDNQVSANATEQKNALLKINNSKSKISELNNLVDI